MNKVEVEVEENFVSWIKLHKQVFTGRVSFFWQITDVIIFTWIFWTKFAYPFLFIDGFPKFGPKKQTNKE